jgi:hypothetical protein
MDMARMSDEITATSPVAPPIIRVRAAARVLCQEFCPAYPCGSCSPSSRAWGLATDMLRAAEEAEQEWKRGVANGEMHERIQF